MRLSTKNADEQMPARHAPLSSVWGPCPAPLCEQVRENFADTIRAAGAGSLGKAWEGPDACLAKVLKTDASSQKPYLARLLHRARASACVGDCLHLHLPASLACRPTPMHSRACVQPLPAKRGRPSELKPRINPGILGRWLRFPPPEDPSDQRHFRPLAPRILTSGPPRRGPRRRKAGDSI